MERNTQEHKAISKATGGEQLNTNPTGVNEDKASQPPAGVSDRELPQGDTQGDPALNHAVLEQGDWSMVVYRKQKTRPLRSFFANGRPVGSNKWGFGKVKIQSKQHLQQQRYKKLITLQ